MSFYDDFIRLCNQAGKSPSRALLDMGLTKSALTRWKNGGKPTDATARRISDYFSASTGPVVSAFQMLKPKKEDTPMTVGEFLQTLDIGDQSSEAQYSDGSKPGDEFVLSVHVRGHGKLMDATVRAVAVGRCLLFIGANGEIPPPDKKAPRQEAT